MVNIIFYKNIISYYYYNYYNYYILIFTIIIIRITCNNYYNDILYSF